MRSLSQSRRGSKVTNNLFLVILESAIVCVLFVCICVRLLIGLISAALGGGAQAHFPNSGWSSLDWVGTSDCCLWLLFMESGRGLLGEKLWLIFIAEWLMDIRPSITIMTNCIAAIYAFDPLCGRRPSMKPRWSSFYWLRCSQSQQYKKEANFQSSWPNMPDSLYGQKETFCCGINIQGHSVRFWGCTCIMLSILSFQRGSNFISLCVWVW